MKKFVSGILVGSLATAAAYRCWFGCFTNEKTLDRSIDEKA